MAGAVAPMPAPDSASAAITRSIDEDDGDASRTAASSQRSAARPTTPLRRSPVRVASHPATGPTTANVSGRAMETNPVLALRVVAGRPRAGTGVRKNPPMYAKLAKNRLPMGRLKLRSAEVAGGDELVRDAALVPRERHEQQRRRPRSLPSTSGLVQPRPSAPGARLRASDDRAGAAASSSAPAEVEPGAAAARRLGEDRGRRSRGWRGPAAPGRRRSTASSTCSTSGPPTTTPTTGPPAATSDQ